MKPLGVLVFVVSLGAGFAAGQAPDPQLIQRLLERVEQLERRVSELQAERTAPTASSAVRPSTVASPAPAVPIQTQQAMPGMVMPPVIDEPAVASRPNLQLAGFGDIDFAASNDNKTHSGFSEGQFTLHFSSQLSRKVSYFGELSLTARPDAGMGSPRAAGFNVEVTWPVI